MSSINSIILRAPHFPFILNEAHCLFILSIFFCISTYSSIFFFHFTLYMYKSSLMRVRICYQQMYYLVYSQRGCTWEKSSDLCQDTAVVKTK